MPDQHLDQAEIDERIRIGRLLLSAESTDDALFPPEGAGLTAADMLELPFPDGLRPTPTAIVPEPDPEDPIPQTDILVITWTVAELTALTDVMTPGVRRGDWYNYRRGFDEDYDGQIRAGAPAKKNRRLGSYYPTQIGDKTVICFKSELHLNQDGISLDENGDQTDVKTGRATLPVRDLLIQLIEEIQPELVITTGTSGATFVEHSLGDAITTRAAKFRLSDEFKNEPFKNKKYESDWKVPTSRIADAEEMMALYLKKLVEPDFTPPTKRYPFEGDPLKAKENKPRIVLDGVPGGPGAIPAFHPVLTTDFFEFGTSKNGLEKLGAAVEMGDAVLGLVCEEDLENPPNWLVIRNVSDPQINGDLPEKPPILNMQRHWAVWYYEVYGYWTSIMSGLATWSVIAGLDDEANN